MTVPLSIRLSAQILDYIRTRRLPAGTHLPEQALADQFRVSRAPIRGALQSLAGEGVVRLERHRGFFLNRDPDELPGGGEGALAGADDDPTYLRIASDRLNGGIPAKVSENEMMRRYRLTRPQVVKIMARIAQEGWAERLPGHGWGFLPVLDSREAYDLGYRFRATIESAALLEPTFRLDAGGLARLRAEQASLLDSGWQIWPRARLFQMNSEFHETLMGWTNNPFFVDAVQRVNRVRRLIEYKVTVDRTRLEQQCREHLNLLQMLEAGETATASAYLRVHIEGARRIKANADALA